MSDPVQRPSQADRRSVRAHHASILLASVYTIFAFTLPPPWVPLDLAETWRWPRDAVLDLIRQASVALGTPDLKALVLVSIYYAIVGLILPWIVMAIMGRGRFYDLGLRAPNRLGWRLVILAWVLAAPLVIWMAGSPTFGPYYRNQLHSGSFVFLTCYASIIISEHFFFHGVLLAIFRHGKRWPAAPVHVRAGNRPHLTLLRFFGLAQPVGQSKGIGRFSRWLGLRAGCLLPIVLSGVLFWMAHLTKDPRELMLSLPGGIALAFLAYRSNSALVPFLTHAGTAGLAYFLITHPVV